MFEVKTVRNGGGIKSVETWDNANDWITAVRESYPDDQCWAPLEERLEAGDYPSTEDWVYVAIEIVESAQAVTISACES
jgi:hypothetical protein